MGQKAPSRMGAPGQHMTLNPMHDRTCREPTSMAVIGMHSSEGIGCIGWALLERHPLHHDRCMAGQTELMPLAPSAPAHAHTHERVLLVGETMSALHQRGCGCSGLGRGLSTPLVMNSATSAWMRGAVRCGKKAAAAAFYPLGLQVLIGGCSMQFLCSPKMPT